MRLLMGSFRQFLTELSARYTSYFRFRVIACVNINVLSPNLVFAFILWRCGIAIANWQISTIFRVICPQHFRCFFSSIHMALTQADVKYFKYISMNVHKT